MTNKEKNFIEIDPDRMSICNDSNPHIDYHKLTKQFNQEFLEKKAFTSLNVKD